MDGNQKKMAETLGKTLTDCLEGEFKRQQLATAAGPNRGTRESVRLLLAAENEIISRGWRGSTTNSSRLSRRKGKQSIPLMQV